jgi:hypothetical protein
MTHKITLAILLLALAAVTGCSTLDRIYVHTPASTNAVTGEVTPGTMAPNPIIDSAIKGVGALPFPWAGGVALLLGWGYSAYAAVRNKKVAVAVIEGIETGRRILQTTPEGQAYDEKIRRALMEHQSIRGVLAEASKLVNSYTDKTHA